MPGVASLGWPRVHRRRVDSTNRLARDLAAAGAAHGTLVTAGEQTAGRGRQGRTWSAPAGRALLMSLVLREPPRLLALMAGVAVCDAVGVQAAVKWPNDVVLGRAGDPAPRKLAGILAEGRPAERWAVLGIGVNVAVREHDLPADLRGRAASLKLPPDAVETVLGDVLAALARWLAAEPAAVLEAWRARDALSGRDVAWAGGEGRAAGVDDEGRLLVVAPDGTRTALDAGEVHLAATAAGRNAAG
jgi:BirA family biotin operon repressor/biotin-[acetyl-CoA-carboxylase] ligase